MTNTVDELKSAIERVEKAHKLLQKLECGNLYQAPFDVFYNAMRSLGDAFNMPMLHAVATMDSTTLRPGCYYDGAFLIAMRLAMPKIKFKYAQTYEYAAKPARNIQYHPRVKYSTCLWHVTAHENNVLREIHATGNGVNSNKVLARLLAATRLYHAVLNKRLAAAKLAPMRVKFKLKDLTDSHKVLTGTPKYSSSDWRKPPLDYVQAMENMSTGPWVPPKNYDEYVAALRAKRDFDKRYKEKLARLREMYDRTQSSYRSPWVGAAAIRFPNYGVTDNQVRYFCTGGRTYRR